MLHCLLYIIIQKGRRGSVGDPCHGLPGCCAGDEGGRDSQKERGDRLKWDLGEIA